MTLKLDPITVLVGSERGEGEVVNTFLRADQVPVEILRVLAALSSGSKVEPI